MVQLAFLLHSQQVSHIYLKFLTSSLRIGRFIWNFITLIKAKNYIIIRGMKNLLIIFTFKRAGLILK